MFRQGPISLVNIRLKTLLRKIIERLRQDLTNNAIISDEIQKLCSEMK